MTSVRVCRPSKIARSDSRTVRRRSNANDCPLPARQAISGGKTLKFFSSAFGSVGMTTGRRQAASVISLYAAKAFNCASGSAITFQTLSKPKATIFKAYGNHFHGPSSIRCIVRKTDISAQRRGQGNGYGRYCNHELRRTLPRTPRDVAVVLSAGYLIATRSRHQLATSGKLGSPAGRAAA